jgi:hypothetical protein
MEAINVFGIQINVAKIAIETKKPANF